MENHEFKINTTEDLIKVISQITFTNTVLDFKWRFEYKDVVFFNPHRMECKGDPNGWLIWVTFERPDSISGIVGRGKGREEVIYEGATISSVVKTCWLLVELMVRHELMEGFRYKDARVFNPHNSIDDLVELQDKHEKINF